MKNKKRKSIPLRKASFEKDEPWGEWVNLPSADEIKKLKDADVSYSFMIKKLYLDEFNRSIMKAFWYGFFFAAAWAVCGLCCLITIFGGKQ